MSVKAYKVEKLAKEPSFKPNDLIEYIFEDVGVAFYGDDDEKYFVWLEKEDLDELEKLLEKYRTGEYEEEEDDEDYEDDDDEVDEDDEEEEFSEGDFKRTKEILRTIRRDLENQKSVMYIVW